MTDVVRVLAGEIGPRPASSDAYRRAAAFIERRFRSLGYTVTRQHFRVGGGISNGAAVQEGDTFNVVASPPGFDAGRSHLLVGAHLDTVPQAPGAVDNAAGIGIVLELARLASVAPPPLPVVFVAFAAEESRLPGGGLIGSRTYVESLSRRERRAMLGAISVDRIGVGSRVSVCTAGGRVSGPFANEVLGAARKAGVPVRSIVNATSDHVSFERADIPAVRIGPDPFAEYHTPRDTPPVFQAAQGERAGRVLWMLLRLTLVSPRS